MKQARALNVLSRIMDWDNDRSQREFTWLRLVSDFKYDSYRDYLAGVMVYRVPCGLVTAIRSR